MIQAKYSTKNYVSNIVQPLISLMSLRSKISKLTYLERLEKILNRVVLPVAYS
jgi:hypothetical protein